MRYSASTRALHALKEPNKHSKEPYMHSKSSTNTEKSLTCTTKRRQTLKAAYYIDEYTQRSPIHTNIHSKEPYIP